MSVYLIPVMIGVMGVSVSLGLANIRDEVRDLVKAIRENTEVLRRK